MPTPREILATSLSISLYPGLQFWVEKMDKRGCENANFYQK